MARRQWQPAPVKAGERDKRLFSLDVSIIGGPVMEGFLKVNPVSSRNIQIRADQTLQDLHHAIFDAFDRWEEHMYEFQFGKTPHDPKAKRYVLPGAMRRGLFGIFGRRRNAPSDLTTTTIGSLGLQVGQSFGYWFDFGDDWYHQIDVVAIVERAPKGKYPKVTKRVGASPPQYPNWDEEGDEGEDDDGEDADEEDDDET